MSVKELLIRVLVPKVHESEGKFAIFRTVFAIFTAFVRNVAIGQHGDAEPEEEITASYC